MSTDRNDVAAAKKLIATDGRTLFPHILLYNSLVKTGEVSDGINGLIDIYSNLMSLHGFMAGFQYVALDVDIPDEGFDTLHQAVFVLRFSGFAVSLFGSLLCLVIQEFLKTVALENLDMQVKSILRYQMFIQMADYLAILALILLCASSNTLLWTKPLSNIVRYACNGGTLVGGIVFLYYFLIVIVKRQSYNSVKRNLYEDPDFGKERE